MVRHEAAEAIGAIGDVDSLDILMELRDANDEPVVVRETCEISVARIKWENSEEGRAEKLRKRYFQTTRIQGTANKLVTSHQ